MKALLVNESPYQVLDARQIKRIEAVHGGFLYQHLYAVVCLFLAAKAGPSAVVVERDEDIEIATGAQREYVQVKTRSAPIMPSDIDDVLRRFSQAFQIKLATKIMLTAVGACEALAGLFVDRKCR